MDENSFSENNYYPNISIPDFDTDILIGSLDSNYMGPFMNQVEDNEQDLIPGSFLIKRLFFRG